MFLLHFCAHRIWLVTVCFGCIRSWLWCSFVNCWISSSPRENWAGWMTWCPSGRRRNWRMHNKRYNQRLQCRPAFNDVSPLQHRSCFSLVSFFRRSTALLQRKKALCRCPWRETWSKSFWSWIIFLILGTQVSCKSHFISSGRNI